MENDDVTTLAVIAEMDLDDARDVCAEEGVPFDDSDPLHVLQEKLRKRMCPRAQEVEPEPEPEREPKPHPPASLVPQQQEQANASGWLKKENHHLIEENKRLQRDLAILTKAAGGEHDIERLRKKLAAANAAVAQRDALTERVAELERQLGEARQSESLEDENFLKLIESQEKLRATCQKQLDEARGISSEWQERYGRLQLEYRQALEAARNATGVQQQQHSVLKRQLEEQRQTEEASRAAGALQAQQRITAAERMAAECQQQCSDLQAREATLLVEHQREVTALKAQLQDLESRWRNAQCRSCKRLLDELDDDTAAAGEVQRMLHRADQEHDNTRRSLLQQVAELDAKVLILEKEARESEQQVRAAVRRLDSGGTSVRGILVDPGSSGVADASLHIKLDEKKATLRKLQDMGLPPSKLQVLQAEITAMEFQAGHSPPRTQAGQADYRNQLGPPPPPYEGRRPQHDSHVVYGEPVVVGAVGVPVAQQLAQASQVSTAVAELMDLGFSESIVMSALQATGGEKHAAADWIFERAASRAANID